ncbi:cobalamin-binding protein [Endozoicomonas acroporae]|uniref:cobalamin-binding protein n=1 Tax=Endozoicomonas acroporae TaxID=1701104 RepID=UPI003D79AA74
MKTPLAPYKTLKNRLPRLMLVLAMVLANAVALACSTARASESDSQYCVTDMSDRAVCLHTRSPRIISLSPGSTELLFAAGAGDRVIAVDQHSDFPEAVKQLPNVGGYPNVSVEAIVAMKPDLVVVWAAGNSQKVIEQLESLGVSTFHIDMVDFTSIKQALRSLGQVAGTEKTAEQVVGDFSARLHTLQSQYARREPVSVFFEIWRSPLMTVGNGLVIDDVISLCGGRNIYGDVSERIPKIGIESLITRDPQVIIGSDPQGDTPQSRKELLGYWSQWQNLQAVQHQQLFSVPSDLIARPTPRILDGAEMICHQLQAVRAKASHTERVAAQIPIHQESPR